jgi:DNA-binding SARP family transcriptional activator/class 3 adenylate cyclase
MTKLTLALLGGFEARVDSGPLLTLPAKSQALLAYLAVSRQSHPREKIATLLWGDTAEAQARQSLRQALAGLRRLLREVSVLRDEGQTLEVDAERVEVDVSAFERNVAEGTPDALERAVVLYQGDLLAGLDVSEAPFEEWLITERERLRELALEGLAKLLAHQVRSDVAESAIRTAGRLLGLDPLQEAVHRTLMRLYSRQGRHGAALREYQRCVRALQQELGIEPEAETKQLYQEILRRRSTDGPTTRTEPPLTVLRSAGPAPPKFQSAERYTPRHLVEKILTAKRAPEAERKHVTALFASLKGSMDLLADRDAEEARTILDPALELMMDAVHRYEGTVPRVMGDGIMAVFGAPVAHEDHAVRACYAALRMQAAVERYAADARRTHGVNVQIRVGLNSGDVIVRAIGSDLRMDYTAVGETTRLAAHLEHLASPGSILLTPSTLKLVEGFVAVKPLGPVPVKGLAAPVDVFEVTGVGPAHSRLQALARRGLTRFVGRDTALEQPRRAEQLASEGHGQVAMIAGEAGVGKSRFVYELVHSHRLQGWLVLEAASVSYGKATSYLPVIDLLKGYFRIGGRDDLREVREKVTGKLLTLDESLKPLLSPLLALLDVPVDDPSWRALDPPERRQRTLDAVKRLLLREAREQPLLVIFEDLHWIDGETQALLDGLVDSLASARLLLLGTYRLEYQHTWGSKTYYSETRLDALPVEKTAELLAELLGDAPGLTPLKQLLVKRGNPFFLEETVGTLVETEALTGERGRYRLTQPIQAIEIPPTVEAVLAARIDRLSSEDKRLLQVAAVVGKDVAFALLQAIAEFPDDSLHRGLDRLQAAEFIYESGLFPDLEYTFKHALTHEVAYGGLLHERRRDLHARIVETIETLYGDRVGEQIERLAHHAVRGELQEKAVHYLRQAGLKATARSAPADARAWFEQALGLLERLPESPSTLEQAFEIRLELRHVLAQVSEVRRALERLREAEILAGRLNDDHRRARVGAFLANTLGTLGYPDEALMTGNSALEVAGRLGDLGLRILTTTFLVQAHFLRGEYERVVELATDNLAALLPGWVYERFGSNQSAAVSDRIFLVMSLAELGRFTEAAAYEAEAIRLAEATHHVYNIGLPYLAASRRCLLMGDWAQAHSLIEHWITVLRTGHVGAYLPLAVARSAWVLAQLGEGSEALKRLEEAEQLLQDQAARGWASSRGTLYTALGRSCLLLGRVDEAQRFGDCAVECSARQLGFVAHALHLLGDVATHPDRFDAESAEARYREALALAEPRTMRPLIAHCHLALGKLYRRIGKRQPAQKELDIAMTMYREMDLRSWWEQAPRRS